MKKSKTKQRKFSYLQEWGSYTNQTYIAIGMNHNEIVKDMKRRNFGAHIIKIFNDQKKENDDRWFNPQVGNTGVCWFHDGKSLLWLPHWKNDWEHWDTIVHEISHLIFEVMCKGKNMTVETEAQAYQLEYLFRAIRRKLWKRFPKNG